MTIEQKNEMLRIRNWLGVLGFLLPTTLLFFNSVFGSGVNPPNVMQSISATHFSIAYAFFECLVAGVGFFLLFYKGYDIKDKILSRLAGIGALGLVFFPTTLGDLPVRNFINISGNVSAILHMAFALLFFTMLIWIIGFQFTKGDLNNKKKKQRNILYYTCAGIMTFGLLIGGALAYVFNIAPNGIFWGEAFALWAFGIAWLVKGKTLKILND